MQQTLNAREIALQRALQEDPRVVRAECKQDFLQCADLRNTILNYRGMVLEYPMGSDAIDAAKIYVKNI